MRRILVLFVVILVAACKADSSADVSTTSPPTAIDHDTILDKSDSKATASSTCACKSRDTDASNDATPCSCDANATSGVDTANDTESDGEKDAIYGTIESWPPYAPDELDCPQMGDRFLTSPQVIDVMTPNSAVVVTIYCHLKGECKLYCNCENVQSNTTLV